MRFVRLTRPNSLILQSDCGHSHALAGIKSRLDALSLLPPSLSRYATIFDYPNFITLHCSNMAEQPDDLPIVHGRRQLHQLQEVAHAAGRDSVLQSVKLSADRFMKHKAKNYLPLKILIGETPNQRVWALLKRPTTIDQKSMIVRFQEEDPVEGGFSLSEERDRHFGPDHAQLDPFKAFQDYGSSVIKGSYKVANELLGTFLKYIFLLLGEPDRVVEDEGDTIADSVKLSFLQALDLMNAFGKCCQQSYH